MVQAAIWLGTVCKVTLVIPFVSQAQAASLLNVPD
jgi:hypothetical protein